MFEEHSKNDILAKDLEKRSATDKNELPSSQVSTFLNSKDEFVTTINIVPELSKVVSPCLIDEKQKTVCPTTGVGNGVQHPAGASLVLIMMSLMMGFFMISLDTTIISTAIPRITTDFHSIEDIGWYNSAYFIPLMALQPTFGKIYSFFNIKFIFIGSLLVFEAGSIICATAPSSAAFIVGRATAGFGAASLYSGGMTIIGYAVPLSRISIYLSLFSSMSAIANMTGPPLGGIFTTSYRLTWRFCFWVNIPFGGIAALLLAITLRTPARPPLQLTLKDKIVKMDLAGTILFISSIVCLFLALQWGGLEYPWSNARVWCLVLGFGLLMIAFVALQLFLGENATIPPRIFRKRSVTFIMLVAVFISLGVNTHTFYLPFYFQSAKGLTAAASGIRLLPYLLSITFTQLAVGIAVAKLGVYLPFMWIGTALFTIAGGLLCTLTVTTTTGSIIGFQLLAGVGFGFSLQLCATAMRASVGERDIPIASALSVFAPSFGGALAASISQSVFRDTLKSYLSQSVLKAQTDAIVESGATEGVMLVLKSQVSIVLEAYNHAVTRTFILAVAAGGLGFLCTLGIKWKNIKKGETTGNEENTQRDEDTEKVGQTNIEDSKGKV